MAEIGHNSDGARDAEGLTKERLTAYVERIERLEEEKAVLAEDIKNVFLEAKGNGFVVKIMRQVIRRRKMDRDYRAEQDSLLELYERALGMDMFG